MITEQKFADLTVKLWRLQQRFQSHAQIEPWRARSAAGAKTIEEIEDVLKQLRPGALSWIS
jgi:hypothetical protein